MDTATCTYDEACNHAQENWKRTNGMVCGGGYWVRYDSGVVAHVDLRVSANGVARPI